MRLLTTICYVAPVIVMWLIYYFLLPYFIVAILCAAVTGALIFVLAIIHAM